MKNKKRILCFIILLSILFVLAGCGSQEGQENGNSLATVTIIGPDDVGVILEETEVEIQKDDTALDVLEKAVQEKNIQLEYSGSGTLPRVLYNHLCSTNNTGLSSIILETNKPFAS